LFYPGQIAVSAEFPSDNCSFDFLQTLESLEHDVGGFRIRIKVEFGAGRHVAYAVFISAHDDQVFDVPLKVFV